MFSFRNVTEPYGLRNHPLFGFQNVTGPHGLCNNAAFWFPACYGTSRIIQQCSLLTSGTLWNFTYYATMGAKYLEAVKQRLHAIKQWFPNEIRVWHSLNQRKTRLVQRLVHEQIWLLSPAPYRHSQSIILNLGDLLPIKLLKATYNQIKCDMSSLITPIKSHNIWSIDYIFKSIMNASIICIPQTWAIMHVRRA